MRRLPRFVALIAFVISWLAVSGCSTTVAKQVLTQPPATAPADPTAWTTVHYGQVALDVPASWPVYDIADGAPRCARFDQSALYLGHQQADASCPAHPVGRTDAAQVEPLDDLTKAQLVAPASTETVNGQVRQDQPGADVTRQLTAAFPGLGVVVTASYLDDPAVAQRIVDSVRAA